MGPELEQDVLTLWSLIFEIIIEGEKRLAAQMAAHDLTPPQFFVLKTLSEHNGRCQIGQIAREHHLTNATMTGLVKRLEAMEPALVQRERSATDKRAVDVILTQSGVDRYMAVQLDFIDQARMVLSLLTPDQRHEIIEKLGFYFKLFTAQFPLESD